MCIILYRAPASQKWSDKFINMAQGLCLEEKGVEVFVEPEEEERGKICWEVSARAIFTPKCTWT